MLLRPILFLFGASTSSVATSMLRLAVAPLRCVPVGTLGKPLHQRQLGGCFQ
jgi:hypothetical protein